MSQPFISFSLAGDHGRFRTVLVIDDQIYDGTVGLKIPMEDAIAGAARLDARRFYSQLVEFLRESA